MKIGFGKYKESEISEVSEDYLKYISSQEWFSKVPYKVRAAICKKLNIPFIYSESSFKTKFTKSAKENSIINKAMKRDLDMDDYHDLKKNSQ